MSPLASESYYRVLSGEDPAQHIVQNASSGPPLGLHSHVCPLGQAAANMTTPYPTNALRVAALLPQLTIRQQKVFRSKVEIERGHFSIQPYISSHLDGDWAFCKTGAPMSVPV